MFKYKIITLVVSLSLAFSSIYSQNNLGSESDFGRIIINSYLSDQVEGLPESAKGLLNTKLSQIATTNGVGGSTLNPRFIITVNLNIITKDLTATAPPITALTIEATFYIGDGIDGTLFASTSFELKGVGTNESKAYIAAIKQIKPANKSMEVLVEKGKTKIIKYYNSRCDFIIKEAQSLSSQKKFEEAICALSSVPEVCKECYEKSMDTIGSIYQQYLDRECTTRMSQAQGIWASTQDINGAKDTAKVLSEIDPDSKCSREASNMMDMLYTEIKSRMLEIDQREWDFILEQQQIEKDKIQAIRDIGVAYGENQPQNVNYKSIGWW